MASEELDVRQLRKPDKHPTIFATYDALAVGEAFILVNNHNPLHLRDEFELEHPGGYGWEYVEQGPGVWRVQISKLASNSLPRIVHDTSNTAGEPDLTGAVWRLQLRERDLDSGIIRLAPGSSSDDAQTGPELDILIHVLSGSGQLTTELDKLQLKTGSLAWLPKRSRRQLTAGPEGLTYLTVTAHQQRQTLDLSAS